MTRLTLLSTSSSVLMRKTVVRLLINVPDGERRDTSNKGHDEQHSNADHFVNGTRVRVERETGNVSSRAGRWIALVSFDLICLRPKLDSELLIGLCLSLCRLQICRGCVSSANMQTSSIFQAHMTQTAKMTYINEVRWKQGSGLSIITPTGSNQAGPLVFP